MLAKFDTDYCSVTAYKPQCSGNPIILFIERTETSVAGWVMDITVGWSAGKMIDVVKADYDHFRSKYYIPQVTNLRVMRPLLNFKDYRKVDVSHINHLRSLTDISLNQSSIDAHGSSAPVIVGHSVLAGGFLFDTDISKAIDPSRFDAVLGRQYVKENLLGKLDDTLWDYEGYRLFRNLTTIDGILGQEQYIEEAHMALVRIVNAGLVIYDSTRDNVYVTTYDDQENGAYHPVIMGSDRQLSYGCSRMSFIGYIRAITILDSYVALQ